MEKRVLRLYDVVGNSSLPDLSVDTVPDDGDPIEIEGEMYYVCETDSLNDEAPAIGVIPLVVRNPASVTNINKYVKCLSKAQRRVQFKNRQGFTDLEHSDEMIIS